MDDVLSCIGCGTLFKGRGRPVCSRCRAEEDKLVNEIRKHLRKNPNASAEEICEQVGVTVKLLSRLIDEGRIIMKHSQSPLSCQICGNKVLRGKICVSCAAQLSNGLGTTEKSSVKKQQNETAKFFNKIR